MRIENLVAGHFLRGEHDSACKPSKQAAGQDHHIGMNVGDG